MSIIRSVLVCCLISLLAGVGLFYLGSIAGYEQFKGGYAILSFDESVNDSEIRQRLDSSRYLFGGSPISESSQWVLLDVFGSIEQIPLDEYYSRVLPFDPRDDGYAAKLRAFFVRDGLRFVYVPLIAGNWKDSFLNKQFTNLLRLIPFSVDYYGIGKPVYLFFISYGSASFILIILYLIRKDLSHRIVNILTLIPLFSAFAFFGAEGIAAASVLFGAFFLLREPLYELAVMPKTQVIKKFSKEIIEPYKIYWLSLFFFAAALALLVIFTGLKLLFLIVIFLVSLAIFFISSKIISIDKGNRRRFSPVAIKKKNKPEFVFFVYMIPFAIAAVIAFLFSPLMTELRAVDNKYTGIICEKDYLDHIEFQASFSVTKLGASYRDDEKTGYIDYSAGDDGLPSVSVTGNSQNINLNDFPAFPLKHLIDFLNNDNNK